MGFHPPLHNSQLLSEVTPQAMSLSQVASLPRMATCWTKAHLGTSLLCHTRADQSTSGALDLWAKQADFAVKFPEGEKVQMTLSSQATFGNKSAAVFSMITAMTLLIPLGHLCPPLSIIELTLAWRHLPILNTILSPNFGYRGPRVSQLPNLSVVVLFHSCIVYLSDLCY